MASSLRPTYRQLSSRLSRTTSHHPSQHARTFRSTPSSFAAQNFTMPAMSPTMTEGNIASWKVKEGDSFATGDVLLEIETDKAQMDVEAQDDGVMAKITQPDGTKAVQVGSRIAVLADPDDDLSTLSLPAEDTPTRSPKDETSSAPPPSKSSPSQSKAPPSAESGTSFTTSSPSSKSSTADPRRASYPLPPSITSLLHEHRLDKSTLASISPTGPNGRLLKGDVLAYLGSISKFYPSEQSARISKLGHLDLSGIRLAAPAPKKPDTPSEKVATPPDKPKDIAVPVSLTAVLAVQKRLHDTLGVHLPLSTFIARATEVANDDLPRSSALSPDELFDEILGLDRVRGERVSRGAFAPQITALPLPASAAPPPPSTRKDIYDILAGHTPTVKIAPRPASRGGIAAGAASALNLFRVQAAQGDEQLAKVFLARVKTVLESEPGRLVL